MHAGACVYIRACECVCVRACVRIIIINRCMVVWCTYRHSFRFASDGNAMSLLESRIVLYKSDQLIVNAVKHKHSYIVA